LHRYDPRKQAKPKSTFFNQVNQSNKHFPPGEKRMLRSKTIKWKNPDSCPAINYPTEHAWLPYGDMLDIDRPDNNGRSV
jgi:hypothetical protein